MSDELDVDLSVTEYVMQAKNANRITVSADFDKLDMVLAEHPHEYVREKLHAQLDVLLAQMGYRPRILSIIPPPSVPDAS